MKKFWIILFCLTMAICIAACSMGFDESSSTVDDGVQFDLSAWEDYGTLSCGRIWCSKLEGDWDTENTESFAYFDRNGNQLSRWYLRCNDASPYNGYFPRNYKNNFVILVQSDGPRKLDFRSVIILNEKGDEIADLDVYYDRYGGAPELCISDFNTDGLAVAYACEWDTIKDRMKFSYYWIDSSGAHRFEDPGANIWTSPDCMEARKLNNRIVLYLGYYSKDAFIYSTNGSLILNVNETIGCSDVISVSDEGSNYNVCFRGKDSNLYNCVIDSQGNFIKQPYDPLTTNHTTPSTNATVILPSSPISALESIWSKYTASEKNLLPIMGGDDENIVMDAPGAIDDLDNLQYIVYVPSEEISSIDDAATMQHAMNGNTFTCGVMHMAEDAVAAVFADTMRTTIQNNQWMCGFPESLYIATLDDYVFIAFGLNDAMAPFLQHVTETFPGITVAYNEPIEG